MWLVFAAGAACCFGLRGILYQWTSKQPADRNVLLFGVYFCGAVIALLLNAGVGQLWTWGAAAGLAMGAFSFISNSSMHKGFSVGKASIVALLSGLPPLVVVIVAFAAWGEKLNWQQGLAFGVIMAGGLLIKSSGGLSLQDWKGAQWGLLAMVTFALTDLSSKQATLWGGQTLPTVAVMYLTGSLMFGITAIRAHKKGRLRLELVQRGYEESAAARIESAATTEHPAYAGSHAVVQRGDSLVGPMAENQLDLPLEQSTGNVPSSADSPSSSVSPTWSFRKTLLVGMGVGITNVSGMLLIMPAFRLGVTGLVSAIIALNVLLILFYARVFLKERFTRMELAGMVLAFCGVLVLRLFG